MSTTFQTSCEECGWTSTPTKTQGLADYAHRLHSCDRQRAKNAARDRRLAREAAVDRTPKPCPHKRVEHQHGTHACYVLDLCRCPPCAAATAQYEQRRVRLHAYGRFQGLVDATPVRDHVRALMAAGMGLKRIASTAGVGGGVMCKLVYGFGDRPPARRVKPATAQRLLAIPLQPRLEDLAAGARVPTHGTIRRIQALARMGWPIDRIADDTLDSQVLYKLLTGRTTTVTAGTALAVRRRYNEIWDQKPTPGRGSTMARRRAELAGWPPPLAWDDDTIDDPTVQPEVVDRTAGSDQAAARTELRERIQELTNLGLSALAIADRTGVTDRTVQRIRTELTRQAS